MTEKPGFDRKIPVYLARCPNYDAQILRERIEGMADSIGLASSYAGRTVLLKPNLISATAPSLACTHAAIVATVAAVFLDRGARVQVGDSPAFGSALRAMERHGILAALGGMDVETIEFSQPMQRVLACGLEVNVAQEALACDLFVNLPKIKAHSQMYVTLAVKNIFGIILGMRKAMLHMSHGKTHHQFAGLILDLLELLPSQVTIVDGIEGMHREGPISGDRLSLGCLAGSASSVAIDTALLALLTLDHQKSPLWREAAKRNLPGCRLAHLTFPALLPEDFSGSGFIAPEVLDGVRFNPIRFLRGLLRRFLLAMRS